MQGTKGGTAMGKYEFAAPKWMLKLAAAAK